MKKPHLGLKNLHNQHHLGFMPLINFVVKSSSTSHVDARLVGFHKTSPWI
jgi:hypothetical protein